MVDEIYHILYNSSMVLSIAVSICVIVLMWQRRQYPGAKAMIALAAATLVWTAGYFLEANSSTLERQLFFTSIGYIGSMAVPVAWFVFAMKYTIGERVLNKRRIVLLSILPTVVLALVWTNGWHHLMWSNEYLTTTGPFLVTTKTYGTFFWASLAYDYALVIAGAVVLIRRLFVGTRLYRGQAISLIIAASLPLIWNIIYIFNLVPIPHKDLTPVMFTISGIVIVLGLMRFNLFKTVPFAHRFIIQQLHSAILVFDVNDYLLEVNPAALKITGADKKIIGKRLEDLVGLSPLFERLSLKEFGLTELQLPVSRNEHSFDFFELETIEMRDNQGLVVGWLAILRNITERKKMQEQVMAQDRLAMMGQLISGVAHELNNPLTGVIGFSDLLMKEDLPKDIKEDIKAIHSEAKRTAQIVNNLLTFARVHPQEKRSVDIYEHIQRVLELRAYEQKVNNIKVVTDFASNFPKVVGNGFQLQQVFLNLVVNAEFFMIKAHNGGTLIVATERVGDHVHISFTDDGLGIPESNMNALFTPFFTTKEVGKGTGLGLSICYGIITEHGGKIWAESEYGNGATFHIDLPIT